MAVEHTEYPILWSAVSSGIRDDSRWESDGSELYKYCKEVVKEDIKMIKEAIVKLSKKKT